MTPAWLQNPCRPHLLLSAPQWGYLSPLGAWERGRRCRHHFGSLYDVDGSWNSGSRWDHLGEVCGTKREDKDRPWGSSQLRVTSAPLQTTDFNFLITEVLMGAVCMMAPLESQALVFPFAIFNVCISFSNLPQSQNGHFMSHYPISGRGKMEEAKRKVYLPAKWVCF